MKKLTELKVIFLTFFMFICAESITADQILPPPKPTIDKETKITITKKKNIYPAKKPNLKKENIKTNVDNVIAQSITENQTEIFIYPRNKPILIKKRVEKIVKKSSFLSQKDFKIAKSAFSAIEKKKMAKFMVNA